MRQDEQLPAAPEKPEPIRYERPQITDYGTLAELTAGKGPNSGELFGAAERDPGGGYS